VPRLVVALTLSIDAPSLTRRLPEVTVCSPFGRWLRERIASLALDWPGIAVEQLRLTPRRAQVTLHAPFERATTRRLGQMAEALRS